MTKIEDLIRDEATHAERHRDDPIPADVQPTKPNQTRMVSFRIDQRDYTALQGIVKDKTNASISDVLRLAVDSFVAEHLKGPEAALRKLKAAVAEFELMT